MFKKLLASVGVGGAEVDTLVLQETVEPGGRLAVNVVIRGGSVEQRISGLNLALLTRVKVEGEEGDHYRNQPLQSWQLSEAFTLQPGEQREFPLQLDIHSETPLTALACYRNQCRVWLQTGLEIDLALDADDNDELRVVPTAAMANFMQAMESLGFQLAKADVEAGYLQAQQFRSSTGCYQELEYKPAGLLNSIQEVEVSFVPQGGQTHALIEVDRFLRGDGYTAMSWDQTASVAELQARLRQLLGL